MEGRALAGIVAMDGTRMTLRVMAKALPKERIAAEMILRREIREQLRQQGIDPV